MTEPYFLGNEARSTAVSNPSICGRVDDVLLSTPSQSTSGLNTSATTTTTFQDFEDDKPDLLQLIVDDEIKQFL